MLVERLLSMSVDAEAAERSGRMVKMVKEEGCEKSASRERSLHCGQGHNRVSGVGVEWVEGDAAKLGTRMLRRWIGCVEDEKGRKG
jgi:hypothetical protein